MKVLADDMYILTAFMLLFKAYLHVSAYKTHEEQVFLMSIYSCD